VSGRRERVQHCFKDYCAEFAIKLNSFDFTFSTVFEQTRAKRLHEVIFKWRHSPTFFSFCTVQQPCGACEQLLSERNELPRLRKEQQSQAEQLRRATERASELEARLSVAQVELAAAREERQNLLESATSGTLGKDEIVRRAFEMRDQAVARKNLAEVELAKSRVENMHVHSQLIEAVQQKVELSQQLEQFQVTHARLIFTFDRFLTAITRFNCTDGFAQSFRRTIAQPVKPSGTATGAEKERPLVARKCEQQKSISHGRIASVLVWQAQQKQPVSIV
jgi:hypothetical protein